MRKGVMSWIAVVVVFGLAVVWSVTVQSQESKRGKYADVVMMSCNPDSSFSVAGYQGSASAPSRKSGACPENLSQLAKEGFAIVEAGYLDRESKLIVYTLAR